MDSGFQNGLLLAGCLRSPPGPLPSNSCNMSGDGGRIGFEGVQGAGETPGDLYGDLDDDDDDDDDDDWATLTHFRLASAGLSDPSHTLGLPGLV